ncbi:hypothetical protein VIM7927_02343 [Vibrio mangrovi]|nr:hypothetical protein VIM7927_02343 [Vibrio mangrovi]
MTPIKILLLSMPLVWYVNLWLGFVFDIGLSEDVIGEEAGNLPLSANHHKSL